MKPENNSKHLLSITQAKGKMFEYDVPIEHHISITSDPSKLFSLAIGLLGDFASEIIRNETVSDVLLEHEKNLEFSSLFFDAFFQSNLDTNNFPYLWLVGSAAYYLSAQPGSSSIFVRKLVNIDFDLQCNNLDKLLFWILLGEYSAKLPELKGPFKQSIENISLGIRRFFISGEDIETLLKETRTLRELAYSNGSSRELLFSDLIGAITKKKYENSSWFCLPYYSDLSQELWKSTLIKPSFSIKEFWPAQHLLGKHNVFRGKSAIVQMPTSAGKTKAIEIIIRSAFLSQRTSIAVIVTPLRSLCHEIMEDLSGSFKSEPVYLNELSDVQQMDFLLAEFLTRNQVLIVTPEKLNYILRQTPSLNEKIGLIIYDEGHQFDNGSRGITYELLLTSLKENLPEKVQSILISAVISNGEIIGNWLNGENSESIIGSKLSTTYRSLAFTSWLETLGRLEFVNIQDPEINEFYVPRVIEQIPLKLKKRETAPRLFPDKKRGNDVSLYLGLKLVKNGNIAIFCGTKTTVNLLCKRVLEIYDRDLFFPSPRQLSKNPFEATRIANLLAENLGQEATLTKAARFGVFAHDNSIPHGIRLSIEYALKHELINFIVCTSTLAQGVNLPLRYLIVTGVYQGKEKIKVRDFQNLMGRSGRAGLHTEGTIIFSDHEIYDDYKRKDYWSWNKILPLLNPSLAEPCLSTLLSVYNTIEIKTPYSQYLINPESFIQLYSEGLEVVHNSILELINTSGITDEVAKMIFNQIIDKFRVFYSIESFLMSHVSESNPNLDDNTVINLAQNTLAYYLANDEQKNQVINIFKFLSTNILHRIPDNKQRIVFGKSLFGVYKSIDLYNWVSENIELINSTNDETALLNIVLPILMSNMTNSIFLKSSNVDIFQDLLKGWISGVSYSKLLELVLEKDTKIKTPKKQRNFCIEDIGTICENGFSYDGSLIIGTISDFCSLFSEDNISNVKNTFKILQKKIRYGLPSSLAIIIFELGFADRILSQALSPLFEDLQPEREIIKKSMISRKNEIFAILQSYPSYFSEVLKQITE